MRKIYILLVLVFSLLSITQSYSQTVTIGAGTSVQRQPLTYYYGYGRSSMIYTAAEMTTTAGSNSIVSVAFYCNTALNTGPTIVYLREAGTTTDQASVTWADKINGATEVYNGTPAVGAAGWRTVTLTAPFPLAANTNLEVMIETNFGGAGTGPSTGNDIRYTTTTNTHQFWQNDGAPPSGAGTVNSNRPNIQIVLGGPIVCVAPPGGGTTQGPAGILCPGAAFTLTVTGASFGTGITYQWESSPDNSTWSPVSGATNASLTTSANTSTYYRRKITCSGMDDYSSALQVQYSAGISTFPWTENFDALGSTGATIFPDCWTKQGGDWRSANNLVTSFDADARSAPNFIQTAWSTSNDIIWTPGFQLTAGTSYDFTFWYADYDASASWTIDVLYNTQPASAGATQLGTSVLASGTAAPTTYTRGRRTFTPSTSGLYYFAIRVTEPTGGPWWLSFDDFSFDLTPPCSAPGSLSVSALTTTTATVNWTASATPPADGYLWEIRSSGAPGSGPAGLVASGSTAAGVLTDNATGLTPNTAYSLYVQSNCTAGSLVSEWSIAFNFRTPCSVIATFPYTETFEAASATRPCWIPTIESGTVNWTYGAGAGNGGTINTAHGGTLNAQYFGFDTESVGKLVSPAFDFSGLNPTLGAQVTFWYANQDWSGDQNELRIYYKTSAAGPWTLIPGAEYTSNVGVWTEVQLPLPASTSNEYYFAFEGTELFGRGIAIDDITVEAVPTCPKPTAVNTVAISPTSAIVSFTSPGNAFVVEYGPVGFVPGTTEAAGAGTIVLSAGSPVTLTGLAPETYYDIYVRRICDPGVDFSANAKTSVTTLCNAVNVPYLQNFETAVPPEFPTCTAMEDVNGNSGTIPNATGGRWTTFAGADNESYVSPEQAMSYMYDAADLSRPADDWFYIQGLNLTAGTSYRLKFFYKGSNGPDWIEKLEVKYGTSAHHTAMTTTLFSNTNIATATADPWDSVRVDFTPASSGVYYIGFHAFSDPDQAFLLIDDISVKVTPVVDMAAVSLTPYTCPAPTGELPVVVRNDNLTPIDFSVHPVTVSAAITAPSGLTTINKVVNTGTLAAGATTTVLMPVYNFAAGTYDVTVTTISPDDPETANDSYTTSFLINPSPTVPVITPAAPQICVGQVVQLNTQFVTPPPAGVPVTASSGTISLAIPDADPAGTSNSLLLENIPADATITSITVTINATHTWNSDLVFNLRAPNGKILNLVNRKGGNGDGFTNAIITSAPAGGLPTANTTITGTFVPDAVTNVGPTGFVSDVANFASLHSTPNGNWTLAVRDMATDDVGTLTSWSITVNYGYPHPKVTWSPATNLFIDANATLMYPPGSDAYSVYAKPATTTTYTVTTTNVATGCTSSRTVTVTVNNNPVVNIAALPTKICISDEAVLLTATPAGGTWSGIGVSGNTFLPSVTAPGSYTLSYRATNAQGCATTGTTLARVESCPERMRLLRDDAVVVYPNPSNGQFNFRINSTLYTKLTMRIYSSASGTLVRTQEYGGLTYNRVIPVDLRHLPGGNYIVYFYYDGGVRTSEKAFKIIISR